MNPEHIIGLPQYKDWIKESREISDIRELKISGFFEVIVVPDNKASLTLMSLDPEIIKDTITHCEDGQLRLKINGSYMYGGKTLNYEENADEIMQKVNSNPSTHFSGRILNYTENGDVNIHMQTINFGGKMASSFMSDMKHYEHPMLVVIGCPTIEKVKVDGSGDVTAHGFTPDQLKIKSSGSGDIVFTNFKGGSVEIELSGSGDITMDGQVESLDLRLSGSGDICLKALEAQNVNARLMGSGDIKIQALASVNARLMGTGKILITGNPTIRNTKGLGTGKIKFK